jgi:hypothetical protein
MRALSTAARPLRSPHSAVRLFDRFYSELPENLVSSRHRPLGGEPLERIVFNDSGWGWQSEDRLGPLHRLDLVGNIIQALRLLADHTGCRVPRGDITLVNGRRAETGSTLAATLHVSW